jgi:hypothetical protein
MILGDEPLISEVVLSHGPWYLGHRTLTMPITLKEVHDP